MLHLMDLNLTEMVFLMVIQMDVILLISRGRCLIEVIHFIWTVFLIQHFLKAI
jgi:hypothetical protein